MVVEENPDKEFAAKLPTTLRDDIGAAFSRVLSDDPSIKVPATRSFMALLQTAMVINGEKRYDQIIALHTGNAMPCGAISQNGSRTTPGGSAWRSAILSPPQKPKEPAGVLRVHILAWHLHIGFLAYILRHE